MDNYLYKQSMEKLSFENVTSLLCYSTGQGKHGQCQNSDQVREIIKMHVQDCKTDGAQALTSGGAGFTLLMGTGGHISTPLSINGILLHEIMEEFRYPKQFVHSMLTNNGSYSRYIEHGYNTDGNLEPKSLSLVLQTPNSPCLNFSCVMRIDLATNAASSLFFTRELTDLTRSLESRGEEMQCSPLAFLNLLFEMHGSMTELYREKRDFEVCVAELQTGTSSLVRGDHITPTNEMNNENLMGELHALNARLLVLDGVMNWELLAGKFIRETYTTLSELRALSTPQDQPLQDSLDYLLNLSSLRQTQAQTLQKRVQMQLGVLYSLISQRDNKLNMSIAKDSKEIVSATRQDSSSMKTIAVLGLIFLPGTFVAAIFGAGVMSLAPPAGNAQAGSAHLAISRAWWIFPAIAVPVTVVTVAVWVVSLRLNASAERRRMKRSGVESEHPVDM